MYVLNTFTYITRYIKISVRSWGSINGGQRWRGCARLLIHRGYNMPNKNPIINLANTQTHTQYNFRCYYNNFNLCFATSLPFLKYETRANIYFNIAYYLVLTNAFTCVIILGFLLYDVCGNVQRIFFEKRITFYFYFFHWI